MNKYTTATLGEYLQEGRDARFIFRENTPAMGKTIPLYRRIVGILVWASAVVILIWLLLYGCLLALHANIIDPGNPLQQRQSKSVIDANQPNRIIVEHAYPAAPVLPARKLDIKVIGKPLLHSYLMSLKNGFSAK